MDGKPYPPNSLYQLCCGIMRYAKETKPDINFFTAAEFLGFRRALDAQMKRLKADGLGNNPKQAVTISAEEEESLWGKGLLGSHSPQTLLDTMVYMCGLYFALRSGQEHRQLTMEQIRVVEKPGAPAYVVYTENTSKNNSGGLQQRKLKLKQVVHYANPERPERCFVQLYKLYCSHRPANLKQTSFYLTAIKPEDFCMVCFNPSWSTYPDWDCKATLPGSGDWWFQKQPLSAYHCCDPIISCQCG